MSKPFGWKALYIGPSPPRFNREGRGRFTLTR
jgi:hypothetical protein